MGAVQEFFRGETGVTAAEYGIILGSIGAIVVLALIAYYTDMATIFQAWADFFRSRAGSIPQ